MVGISGFGSAGNTQALNNNLNNILSLTQKLATGKRINKASDDPAGLVVSQRLAAQVKSFSQAIDNVQRSSNVISVADTGAGQISGLLQKARSLASASAGGGLSEAEIAANQAELDNIVSSVTRIAGTTNFAGANLIDGSLEPRVENISNGIDDVQINEVGNVTDVPRTVDVEVTAQATQAELTGTITDQTGDVEFLVQGNLGSATINISDGATAQDVTDAINATTSQTGVLVSGGLVRSVGYGGNQFVNVEELSGTLDGVTAGNVQGTDIQGTLDGQTAAGSGTTLSLSNSELSAEVTFDPTAAPGSFSFDVASSGFDVALGSDSSRTRSLGFDRLASDSLGTASGLGALTSVATGGDNELSVNPANAIQVIDQAIDDVSSFRGRLGAFQTNTIESTENSFRQALSDIDASRSRIEDADYAATLSELSSAQIREQANIALQAQIQGLNRQVLLGILLV